ncbi:MAG: hypothetical protein JXB40_03350 [Candidatus Omnitrophica bacterium]|nr:hypothetical protein [Candidatus Omnitrophota bacterium]
MIPVTAPARAASLLLIAIFTLASAAFGEGYRYDSHGKRDPFIPLVGIEKPVISSLADITSVSDIKLEGIASIAGGKMAAILNGEIAKEGDRFGEIEIIKIEKRTVTIKMGDRNYELKISEEMAKAGQ